MDFQVATGIVAVRQIPIAAEHQILLYRQGHNIVQLLHRQVAGIAAGGEALFFIPQQRLQVEGAAHGRPAGVVHYHPFGAGFQLQRCQQFEVEGAADVQRAHAAAPLVLLVKPAVGSDVEAVGFAVEL